MATNCTHLDQIRDVQPSAQGCEECLQTGDTWVHLRECLVCGHIGCCDSSKNKHATKHFHATDHPLVQSFQSGEDWIWCSVDEVVTAAIQEDVDVIGLSILSKFLTSVDYGKRTMTMLRARASSVLATISYA